MADDNLDFFKELVKDIDNEYAGIMEEFDENVEFIDTGSYSLNALLSGSIYGGIPDNTVTALAGEPSTGKTFYAISIMKNFLESNKNNFVFFFESENAVTKNTLKSRGVNTERVFLIPVSTVEEFRTEATKILDKYLASGNKSRMMFVLDSLGNLSTAKEMEDIASGSAKRDMTRAQLIRGAFRVLTLKLGKAKVPLLCTNHVYEVVGSYVPIKKMGGGAGLDYAASTIPFLSKKKGEKDKDNNVLGAIITLVLKKARHTIENKKVETFLNYEKGLDRYWGLLDLALKFGIFTKVSTKVELPNGEKVFQSQIEKDPVKYFTKEILNEIDKHCKLEFCYGKAYGEDDTSETTADAELISTDKVKFDPEAANVSYGFEPLTPETKKKREKK